MHQYTGVLKINLSALRRNWCVVRDHFRGRHCGAVVKANAYGLGVAPVVQSLFSEGCRHFFVATFDEAVQIRRLLPSPANVFVLQGVYPGMEQRFSDEDLVPVIYSVDMLRRWLGAGVEGQRRCALKLNTGMNRLGMELAELHALLQERQNWPDNIHIELVMSHLACADEPEHPMNFLQLEQFQRVAELTRQHFSSALLSLTNSAGVFLSEDWHFDLARPGIALYGGCCIPALKGRLSSVVTLELPVIQSRHLKVGEAVGYGADFIATRDMTILVVSGGYADGVLRSLTPRMAAWRGVRLPILGRVSMDSCVFDASHLAPGEIPREGQMVEIISDHLPLDEVAEAAGTISYELLTRLGERLTRIYCEDSDHVSVGLADSRQA